MDGAKGLKFGTIVRGSHGNMLQKFGERGFKFLKQHALLLACPSYTLIYDFRQFFAPSDRKYTN